MQRVAFEHPASRPGSEQVLWVFWFTLFSVILSPLLGVANVTPNYSPSLQVTRTTADIDVDGSLTDEGWRGAARATGFVECEPGDQIEPVVRSEAWVTYDESNLYVALIAWDEPAEVRQSLSDRDNIFRDDYFGVLLDTYNDFSWGYELFFNPKGIQGDLRVHSDGLEDGSLDLVMSSEGLVTDSGYQVEIAIPFASLRFPSADKQTWRINFWRDRQRDKRYRYSWTAQDRDNSCWMCQWGTLHGIEGIEPGSNIDILPNIVAYQSGQSADVFDPQAPFDNRDPDAELSLNARYGLTSNSSLEFAINPDFSQVESDAGQIDVNTTFALFFDERRPFFQEGSDLWSSWIAAVYTRSINNPEIASKFTGQFGRTSIGYLLARDKNSPLIVPLQQQSPTLLLNDSWVNIVRARQAFGQASHVGILFSDRRTDEFTEPGVTASSGAGTNYGVDARFRLSRSSQIEMQVVGSHTEEPVAPELIDTTHETGRAQETFDYGRHTVALDGETFDGQAVYFSFEHNASRFFFDFDYWEYSPTFRADNGFETRNDLRLLGIETNVTFRPNREWLVLWQPRLGFGRTFDHNATIDLNPGEFKKGTIDEWFRPGVYLQFKGQTEIDLTYLQSRERFGGFLFQGISIGTIYWETQPVSWLSFGGRFNYGKTIYRRRYRELPGGIVRPELGIGHDIRFFAELKVGERLRIEPVFDYSELNYRDGYLENNPGVEREIFSGYIFRTRLNYQFSRPLFVRLIVEYDDFEKDIAIEPLLTYKINPFTVFYIGMASSYQHFDREDFTSLDDDKWKLQQRQFFAKLQYLIRI